MSCKRNGTRHLTIYSAAVQTDATVFILNCLLHQHLDIIGFAASSHPVHDEDNGLFLSSLLAIGPVQSYVAAIYEVYFLAYKWDINFGGDQLVDRLQEVVP